MLKADAGHWSNPGNGRPGAGQIAIPRDPCQEILADLRRGVHVDSVSALIHRAFPVRRSRLDMQQEQQAPALFEHADDDVRQRTLRGGYSIHAHRLVNVPNTPGQGQTYRDAMGHKSMRAENSRPIKAPRGPRSHPPRPTPRGNGAVPSRCHPTHTNLRPHLAAFRGSQMASDIRRHNHRHTAKQYGFRSPAHAQLRRLS